MRKICTKCKKVKDFEEFPRRKTSKDGKRADCKVCHNESRVQYRNDNRELLRKNAFKYRDPKKDNEYGKLYRENNKEEIAKKNKIYRSENKEKINKRQSLYKRHRTKTDVNFKLRDLLRNRLYYALKDNYKSGSAVRDLGCSIEFLKQYLESKFKPGMTWDNHSLHGWHIDHIKPLSKFDLSVREQLLEAVNYTNLQPLWAAENLKKAAKYG